VAVGHIQATANVLTPQTLTASTPPSADGGLRDVVVLNPDGGTHRVFDAFRYVPLPLVRAVLPDSGPGQTSITVIGENFDTGTIIQVGNTTVPVDGGTANHLTCKVPAGTAGQTSSGRN
jgi:hypothetical protein